jgi:protein TonB
MDLQTLKTADYLDIVFDNRNKSYGGYQLRRTYGQRVGRAVAILYSGIAGLALYALFHKSEPAAKPFERHIEHTISCLYPPVTPPVIPPPPAPRPPQPQAAPRLRTEIFTNPILTNEVIPDDQRMARADALVNAQAGLTHNGQGDDFTSDIRDTKVQDGTNTIVTDPKPNVPVVWVEQMPEFNGDLVAYLSKHVQYPEVARESNVQGRVVVRFVVNEDGSISDASIVKGIGGGCDEEALRVISAMPKWKPGRQNGRALKVFFQVPIMFTLQ